MSNDLLSVLVNELTTTSMTTEAHSTTDVYNYSTTSTYDNHTTTHAPLPKHLDALKCLLLAALLVLCFIFSIVPFTLRKLAVNSTPETRRLKYALVFTLLSCYGGGIFLGTCLLDLLPDGVQFVQDASKHVPLLEHDNFPLAEFLVAIGFFVVLFTEQFVMWLKDEGYLGGGDNTEPDPADMMIQSTEEALHINSRNRGRTNTSLSVIGVLPTLTERDRLGTAIPDDDSASTSSASTSNYVPEVLVGDATPVDEQNGSPPVANGGHHHRRHSHHHEGHGHGGHDHDLHFDPGSHSTVRAMLLVTALSLHSVFEGLALGLTPTVSEALSLFGALSIHKSLIAFSVGLRLVQSQLSTIAIFASCATFCVMAPIGGFAGVALIDAFQGSTAKILSGCLTSVACGTFLYVTCFEILPHELNNGEHRLAKLCCLMLGFVTICVMVGFFD